MPPRGAEPISVVVGELGAAVEEVLTWRGVSSQLATQHAHVTPRNRIERSRAALLVFRLESMDAVE